MNSKTSARPPLRPLDDALAELLTFARPLEGSDSISTFDADSRVLAQDLVSQLQVPPQDNSAMDGYAVRRGEIADEGVPLPVSDGVAHVTALSADFDRAADTLKMTEPFTVTLDNGLRAEFKGAFMDIKGG